MASTRRRPPIWNTGLIQPERTRAQIAQGLPPSSPRTPTIGERAFRASDRIASIERWTRTILAVELFIGQFFSPFDAFQSYLNYAFGAWILWSLRGLLRPLGGSLGRARTRSSDVWVEHPGQAGDRLGGAWDSVIEVPWRSLSFFPTVYHALVIWWRGEDAPARTRIRAEPRSRAEPMSRGDWKIEGEFTATRCSRDRVSPRALRTLGIPFLMGNTPDWLIVLEGLTKIQFAAVDARTQYYRRRRKGMVSQEERDEYDEDGDDEEDGERLPPVQEPRRWHTPSGTTGTRLDRRFTSLQALRQLRLSYHVLDKTHVIIMKPLTFDQVQKIYQQSQTVRRRREGLVDTTDDEDDLYDLGRSEGDSGDDSDDDYDPGVVKTRHVRFASRRQTARLVLDGPDAEESVDGLQIPRQSRSRSSKRSRFEPRRAAEAAKPIYLDAFMRIINARPTAEEANTSAHSTRTPSRDFLVPGHARREDPLIPAQPVSRSNARELATPPAAPASRINPTPMRPTSIPRPSTVQPVADSEPIDNAPTPTPAGSTQIGSGPAPTVASPEPAGVGSAPTPAPSTVPMNAPDALQPVVRDLAMKAIAIRTDCIAVWKMYHHFRKFNIPMKLEIASQRLLQQANALASKFGAIFNVDPRPSIRPYISEVADLERGLDDALGLLQLFRQALDAENPSCPTFRSVRNCLAGIAQSLTTMQGMRYTGTDSDVSDLRRRRLRSLIPEFAVEDENTARLAEELRTKEKMARDEAQKEKAEKQKAEEERIAAMSPMDQEPDTTEPPPAAKPPGKLPPGTDFKVLKKNNPIGFGWTPAPFATLKGPQEYIKALQFRLSQGFLPTSTSGMNYLCGLRAILISLESMGRLTPGQVTPNDILQKMFVEPKLDLNYNPDECSDGHRGRPTAVYQQFLAKRRRDGDYDDSWERDAVSLQNFSANQLIYVLQLLHSFGLEATGDDFPLGIVTAGINGGPASVQIHHRGELAPDPQNIVWVFNDNWENDSPDGKGISHWEGFAQRTLDRAHGLERVRKWGLKIPTLDELLAGSNTPKATPTGTHKFQQGRDEHQSGPERSFESECEHLQDLKSHFIYQGPIFDVYRADPTAHQRDIEDLIVELDQVFTQKVRAIEPLGTREERDKIIADRSYLIAGTKQAIAELCKLLSARGDNYSNQFQREGDQRPSGNETNTQNQSKRRTQSARGHGDNERGRQANQERPDTRSRNRSDNGTSTRGQNDGRRGRGKGENPQTEERANGRQSRSDSRSGPQRANGANGGGLGAGQNNRREGGGNRGHDDHSGGQTWSDTRPGPQNASGANREGLRGRGKGSGGKYTRTEGPPRRPDYDPDYDV